jgi:hypothetical protein
MLRHSLSLVGSERSAESVDDASKSVDDGSPLIRALNWYDGEVSYYQRARQRSRRQWIALQVGAIVLTGATPVIVAITSLPTAVKAAPAALAGILTSLSLASGLRNDFVRWTTAEMSLRHERLRLDTRTPPYHRDATADELAEAFVERILAIADTEVSGWHEDMRTGKGQ